MARDLAKMDADCVAFETDYKGKLAEFTARDGGGAWLAQAVRRYEAIDDLAGRLGSYAGLIRAGDSVDPAISKFYGDVSERLTAASTHLLFFALELNRVDDDVIERAMQTPELGHYRPWIEDLRKDKPYQLEDRVEQLFHEKSQSGYSAWNRLFDQTIAALRFKVGGKELAIEPTLNFLQDRAGEKRKAAAKALAKTFKDNERTFALVTNTLAKDKEISDRWRGFKDVADSRHLNNRVEREVVDALVDVGARGLSKTVASLLRAEGRLVQKEEAAALGPQRAVAVCRHRQHRLAGGARTWCCRPIAASRLTWPRSPSASSPTAGSMRRCGPARRRAPSRIRPRRRRIPMCC